MAPKRIRFYEFTVTGSGQFPVDMLRYDCCWPHTQEAVVETRLHYPPRLAHQPRRTVALISSIKPPTPERWSSFGWTVSDVKAIT